jgi:TolA-binding protein
MSTQGSALQVIFVVMEAFAKLGSADALAAVIKHTRRRLASLREELASASQQQQPQVAAWTGPGDGLAMYQQPQHHDEYRAGQVQREIRSLETRLAELENELQSL